MPVDINVSDELDLGVAGYETIRYGRGEVHGPGHTQYKTVVRVVADALVTGQKLLEFTVVKLNADKEVDVYTFADYEAGILPFGLSGTSVEADELGASIPVITNGSFNVERIVFDPSFDTVEKKMNSFMYTGSNIKLSEFLFQGIE